MRLRFPTPPLPPNVNVDTTAARANIHTIIEIWGASFFCAVLCWSPFVKEACLIDATFGNGGGELLRRPGAHWQQICPATFESNRLLTVASKIPPSVANVLVWTRSPLECRGSLAQAGFRHHPDATCAGLLADVRNHGQAFALHE